MTKGIYVFVNGNVIEVNEEEFRKEIEKKQIERLYIRFRIDERVKSVRVYDTFTAEPFEEYIPLDEIFILQKRTNSNPIGVERGILRKEDSLLVALINNESIEKAIRRYGREGFAVSEYDENILPPIFKAA